MEHYVYEHFDPFTHVIVYVGTGTGGRAWSSTSRSSAHKAWLGTMARLGLTPDQFVRITARGLSAQAAFAAELAAIHRLNPPLNVRGTPRGARGFHLRPQKKAPSAYLDTRDFELVNFSDET